MAENEEYQVRLAALQEDFAQGKLHSSDFKKARLHLMQTYGINTDEPKASKGNYGKSK